MASPSTPYAKGLEHSRLCGRTRLDVLSQHLAPGMAMASAKVHATPNSPVRTCLITGVTSGIGRTLAIDFASRGFRVVGCGRRKEALKALERELLDPMHFFHECDVADIASVVAFKAALNQAKGDVDIEILICNAGIAPAQAAPIWEIPTHDFDALMKVNVNGVFYTTQVFLPDMLEKASDPKAPLKRVIMISSGLGHSTSPVLGSYSSSKFAIEAMAKSVAQALLASEQARYGQGVICIPFAPGVLKTEMNPEGGDLDEWVQLAVPLLLNLSPRDNGTSIAMPGYYAESYRNTWIIKANAPLNDAVKVE
eukprot:m.149757 g.149757  ORF g.149757 m.149757 type:complete len:310 (-) comp30681_c0_seq2:182-1111(-)